MTLQLRISMVRTNHEFRLKNNQFHNGRYFAYENLEATLDDFFTTLF